MSKALAKTLYDTDVGNNLERVRRESRTVGVFLTYSHRWCSWCKQKKNTKGGTRPGPTWACADCKAKGATPGARYQKDGK